MQNKVVDPSRRHKIILKLLVAFIVILNVFLFVYTSKKFSQSSGGDDKSESEKINTKEIHSEYGGSQSCAECHVQAFEKWRASHHSLAERQIISAVDKPSFDPPRKFKHGTQVSEVKINNNRYEIITTGTSGKPETFFPDRILGVSPLRQFVIPFGNGRYQLTEIAVDSRSNEWFNVYGDEDRQPGEWGHWTGRGMNWNSMCGVCHNTRLFKNYDPKTDSYNTKIAEMGVGCEACHGPLRRHNEWQKKNPNKKGDTTITKFSTNQWIHICGSCHSRRGDLNGNFAPGDNFFNHYTLVITDETDIYYPDGQVRDEDFELGAFLSSRMGRAGVSCMDCHDPHTGKNILRDNALCMRCHETPIPPAPKIDAQTHSHHKSDTPGFYCKDCHMPQTVYMQRHWRRDHGFGIPDPRMTTKFNIPNACNRCHTNKSPAWAQEYVEKWYGERMNRWSQERTIAVALAREGKSEAIPGLLKILNTEQIPLWRAAAVNLLKRWLFEPRVQQAILSASDDPEPIVRENVARALENYADFNNELFEGVLKRLLNDRMRAVRVRAAWALRSQIDANSPVGQELMASMIYNSDQPAGLLQLGVFHFDRGESEHALELLKKALTWEPKSAPLHYAIAVCHSVVGRPQDAIPMLEKACQLNPREAEYKFKLALAYYEGGLLDKTIRTLEETVKLDPEFSRAWYNLGLAYNSAGRQQDALSALNRAEVLNEYSAEIPYARATILFNLNKYDEAKQAVLRALKINPNYADAINLLKRINR
ncbi:MAG: tetratricopeptide repeat protein [Verrucomicrobiae bacterium]|nr:tetratricopeptide repeat protein [Verrucomicrobiae bacterium]